MHQAPDVDVVPAATGMHGLHRIFVFATVLVVLALAAFGLVGLAAAMLGHATAAVVLPVGLPLWLLLLLLWRPDRDRDAPRQVRNWVVLAGVVVIAAATVTSLLYHGQYVLTNRDPGIYSNGGGWIAQHGNLVLDSRRGVLDGMKNLQSIGLGQSTLTGDDTRLEIQGAHLFPVFLAFGFWVAGAYGLFAVPAILGGIALALIFLVGLRLLPDWMALTVVTAVAVDFAWIYAVRSVLSEPLMTLFAFAGVAFTAQALAARSIPRLFVSGLVVAISLMIRLDAGVAVLLMLPAVAFLLARSSRRSPGVGPGPWLSFGWFVGGWLIPAVLGWLDLNEFARFYLFFNGSQFRLVERALSASLLMAILVLALSTKVTSGDRPLLVRLRALWARRRSALGVVGAGAVLVVAAVAWWIRPLLGQHLTFVGGPGAAGMEAIQKRDGLPLSGNRTYDELSISEIGWYVGPLVMLGAFLAVAVLVRRFVSGRLHDEMALFVALVVPITALYLYRPSIYPDQPWAIRRFVPVTIPGLLVLAAWLGIWLIRRSSASGLLQNISLRRGAYAAVVAIALLPPLLVSWPLRSARWEAGGIGGMNRLCSAIGPHGVAILSLEIGSQMLPAVRGFCAPDVATAKVNTPTAPHVFDATGLAGKAAAVGRTLTIVATSKAAVLELAPTALEVHAVIVLRTTEVVATLERPPATVGPLNLTLWVGRVPPGN